MFRQVISNTPMTSAAANGFFQNIVGDGFNRDYTFISTLRALVAPRIGDDTMRLTFSATDYTTHTVNSNPVRDIVRSICNNMPAMNSRNTGVISIHNCGNSSQDANYACLEAIKSLPQYYDGWHLIQKVTDFYRKSFYVLCFINPEKKNVALFVDNMDVRKMHYLQCSIFAFLPWYFDPEKGVSELEMELINSLREKTPDKYENCIEQIAAQYDFRTQRIRQLLTGFETRYEQQELDKVRRNIESYLNEIDSLNNRISEYFRAKADEEIRLLGLEAKLAQNGGDSEIMEYFLCNQKLVLENVTADGDMDFACMDYLTYFDEEIAKSMIDNPRSCIYRPSGRACNNIIPAEDMKKLMYAIFIDQTLRIKFCASYRFSIRGNVRGNAGHSYGSEFRNCMPNTHIDRYACLGNNEYTINQLLKNHDYITALEQAISSCKSLNFADGAVMEEFMRRFYGISDYGTNNRCIELPDGSVVTPKEAVVWMKKQEEEAKTDE